MKKTNKTIIVSPDIYDDSRNNLQESGFNIINSFKNKNVSLPLVHHTDMQLCVCDGKIIVSPDCFNYYSLKLSGYDLIKGNTYLSCNYPYDIAYNIIVNKNYAVGNFKYTDSVLLEHIRNKELINIAQGYAACTAVPICDNAFITSDKGIYNTLTNNKFDVLLIDDKDILLPGYNHGFFGGSVFVLNNTLYVNGDLKKLNDYKNILSFCHNYKMEVISLSDKTPMDIGSIVVI